MKRVLSGIKPSGDVTLGNYLGAMKRWADEQQGQESFYFVPNLHALTSLKNGRELKHNTLSAVAWLLVMGINPRKSTVFVQSDIPAHAELCWILNNFVTMGELSRMTQYKDKSQLHGKGGQLVGLFNYPVLMAADILLYDADEVPVGEDQLQHVELTRTIASRFNNQYGKVFKLPKATIQKSGARIMNLQNPSVKMSASDKDSRGVIFLSDSKSLIEDKIAKAVTDSGKQITYHKNRPAIANLLQIYSLISGDSIKRIEARYQNKGYAEFKKDLSTSLTKAILPLQQKHKRLLSSPKRLQKVIKLGNRKASKIASTNLDSIKIILGL